MNMLMRFGPRIVTPDHRVPISDSSLASGQRPVGQLACHSDFRRFRIRL
jgi:hypothetical protein